jgi:hypothetical protein
MAKTNKAKSPYNKYGKRPYQYSELYQRWRTAMINRRENEARSLGQEHTARFMKDG